MIDQAHGGVGLQHVTKGKLDNLAIVLPPLREQQRIVARVDELMALCDRLEARLTATREKSAHLAASVVHHLAA
jgi:type I restriction enzyme S subunit